MPPSIVRRLAAVILLAVAAFAAGLACGDYVTGPRGAGNTPRVVRGLTLGASRTTLTEGDTMRLRLTALDQVGGPFAAMPASVVIEWTSEDEDVATVNESGLVTATGVGTTRIMARATNIAGLQPVSVQIIVRSKARLVITSSPNPSGRAGEPLAPPVRVRVEDPDGAGLADAVVRFVVVAPGGDSAVTDVTTGNDGTAELPLTFGTRAGEYVIHARLRDAPEVAASIVAIAVAADAAVVEIVSGGGQAGTVGDALAQPLVVRVTDRYGNPVADSMVTFTVNPGSGAASPVTARTDASGLAATRWTLGTVAGAQRVVATVGAIAGTPFDAVARPGPVTSVLVEPDALTFATLGRTARLTVTLADRYGNAITDQPVTWSSSVPLVASVDATGAVRALSDGSAFVIATAGGAADTTAVTVRQVVASVVATPPSVTLQVGATAQLTAIASDSGGTAVAAATIAWRSENASVAQVDGRGVVTAVDTGSARVIASSGDYADTVIVNVPPVRKPGRIDVQPEAVTVDDGPGQPLRFSARVYDTDGVEMPDEPVTWTSSDENVAFIEDQQGQDVIIYTGRYGQALVVGTAGTVSDTAVVTVRRTTRSISVVPQQITLAPGQTAQLTATAFDYRGDPIDGATFTWESSNSEVATVDQSGLVTGVGTGTATISASSDGVTGSATSATITTCGPTGIAPFGTAQSLGPPECVLRLNSPWNPGSGGAWSTDKPRVVNGFDVTFHFRISSPGNGGADGFAFIVQGYNGNFVGGGGGGIGYHGLPRSVAVEFDTWPNGPGEANDPDDNHISVHTNGLNENNVDESYSIGRIDNVNMPFQLDDGAVHEVRVRYVPGTMEIYLDGRTEPSLTVRVDLGNIDGAGGSIMDEEGRLWMGFTAATGFAYETHDILDWDVRTTP